MFKITIDDVLLACGKIAISGKCENKESFTSKLIDENGIEYSACIPFIKYFVPPEIDYITLELSNIKDPENLVGLTLRSV